MRWRMGPAGFNCTPAAWTIRKRDVILHDRRTRAEEGLGGRESRFVKSCLRCEGLECKITIDDDRNLQIAPKNCSRRCVLYCFQSKIIPQAKTALKYKVPVDDHFRSLPATMVQAGVKPDNDTQNATQKRYFEARATRC